MSSNYNIAIFWIRINNVLTSIAFRLIIHHLRVKCGNFGKQLSEKSINRSHSYQQKKYFCIVCLQLVQQKRILSNILIKSQFK